MNMTNEQKIEALNDAMLSAQNTIVSLDDLPGNEFAGDIIKLRTIQDHIQKKIEEICDL